MSRPLVMIHGYSAEGTAFDPLRDALLNNAKFKAKNITIKDINICTYVSLNNEITIKDIAEGLDRAFRQHNLLGNEGQEFDAIVHSTGMLVLRSWLTNYGAAPGANKRLSRLKHLIGLAPATWGSPQAHKGRTWLGALVKGDKHLGPDFLNAGDKVLAGLELGSQFTWELAHADLLGPAPYYDRGPGTPYVSVFIGNQPYEGLESVANDPGTDGTVRWAGCGLNTRKIKVDLTRTPVGEDGQPAKRITISSWANRLDIPMIPVEGRNHSTLISNPDPGMVELLVDFLSIGEPGGEAHDSWLARAKDQGKKPLEKMLINPGSGGVVGEIDKLFGHGSGAPMEGWQQFVVYARDERGDGVSDYMIEVLRNTGGVWETFKEMYTDVHSYGLDQSYRCFHIRLPRGISGADVDLKLRIHASTGTELMAYQGYGDGSTQKQLAANTEPVELHLGDLGNGHGSLFCPFTTTLIEIVLNREPLPLNQISRILTFLSNQGPGGPAPQA